jgi:MinD-like ATPase involved in chromosome partitioning or flagellar assembly
MTAATAEASIRTGWVPVPEHAFNRANRPPAAAPVRMAPLLAVCGLAGGAGVSTLSYLIALAAARQWADPVLVADTGGPSGGLAACAGVEVLRSLGELAQHLAAGIMLGAGIYETGRDGLRILAAGPEFSSPPADGQVRELLAHAREAHGLTVIDCGTLARGTEQTAAAAATHVAWVLTAAAHRVKHGRRVLEAAPRLTGKELIVARNDVRRSSAPLHELRRLAAERRAPLVLVPHLTGLDASRLDACAEAAQVPVQAILGALRR